MRVWMQGLVKKFGETIALQDITLDVQSRELFFLLGPSGCGKTTLLRLLAGFYQPDAGTMGFGERPMNGVPPHQRNTGMVFQNYALWPHMSVAENVAYGLEVRGLKPAEMRARVEEALAIVQMGGYAQRLPNQLSGGQQQRIALARALVINPDVLLLDEPLSNLDAKLRLEMREEIRRIHAQTRITTIYVTHDQKEALSLANRIALLRDGRVEQVGDARAIYREPANRFVADFIGETNWLAGKVIGRSDSELVVETDLGRLTASPRAFQVDQKVLVGFRPESVSLGKSPVNGFTARIRHLSYLGEIEQYVLEYRDGKVMKAMEQNPAEIRGCGTRLDLYVRPQDVLVFPESRE